MSRYNVIASLDEDCPLTGSVLPGDQLLFVNKHEIKDVLDYKYWTYERKLLLEFRDAGKIRISKEEGQDLGINFETYLMDKPTSCANRCIFCFVDQMPKGMRSTLYFKDDDARLSFLTGNYVTCTNLSERELQRICDLRVSPLNVSVHTTEPELRARMLCNPRGAEIMNILQRFSDAGIEMDCQVVVCPGWNDGEHLTRTMKDLSSFYPAVSSVSIIPVGLTKHRETLPYIEPFNKKSAADVIALVKAFSNECLDKLGSRIFFCSDEFYLKAELPLPEDEEYEGYPQLENGVGLIRLQETEFRYALEDYEERPERPFSIATGVSAAPFMERLCREIGADAHVYAIKNDFFGHSIDVAGLITGNDLIRQLHGKDLGDFLLIPEVMLRNGETVFLDDVSQEDVSHALGVPVLSASADGYKLFNAMLGRSV